MIYKERDQSASPSEGHHTLVDLNREETAKEATAAGRGLRDRRQQWRWGLHVETRSGQHRQPYLCGHAYRMQRLLLLLRNYLLRSGRRRAMYYVCCHIWSFSFHQLLQHESIWFVHKGFVKSITGIVFAIQMGSPMWN